MKALAVQSLPCSIIGASLLAGRLGVSADEISVHRFPDHEIRITVPPAGRTTIVYASLDNPHDKLLALLFAADALRQTGCRRLVLVAPYLCYMRQDTNFHTGEAISQKVLGGLLADVFDRIVTVEAHLHRTTDIRSVFPDIESDNLTAIGAIGAFLRQVGFDQAMVVVGPDAESESWVKGLAANLGLQHVVGQKTRRDDSAVEITFAAPSVVSQKPVLLVDDIVSTGTTLANCAKRLKEAGALSIDAIIVHALFKAETAALLSQAGIRSVLSSTSVIHPTNAIPLDDLLATALRSEVDGTAPAKDPPV